MSMTCTPKTPDHLPGLLALLLAVSPAAFAAPGPPVTLNSRTIVKSYTPAAVPLPVARHARDYYQPQTYTLVKPPDHGTLVLPGRHRKEGQPAKATYISDKDYVGTDTFSWKVNDSVADSNCATSTVTVTAAPPVPELTRGYVIADTPTDIPALYSGGGGYSYKVQGQNPTHGTLTANGTTFRYTPNAGFTGGDSFTWTMTYATDKGTVTTKAVSCWILVKAAGMTDWPQWRADEWRSGFTTMGLPAELRLQWRRDFPAAKGMSGGAPRSIDYCRPVQMGKTIFVPVAASDCLAAFNTETGELRWRFYASGAVRRPPLAMALAGGIDVVIFGSDDGWVYALNAADGSVRWKFRAAPNNRKAMGFGRLSSVWPIWASPIGCDGKVYFVAGYLASFGLYAYCLDAATGSVVWVNDGRMSDIWNTSAFGPPAFSLDRTRIYGGSDTVSTPWVLDALTGEYLGHMEVGFGYPGKGYKTPSRNFGRDSGLPTWYVDGQGSYHLREPMTITAGSQTFTQEKVAAWGLTGTVASLLAGDGKLFVTTAEGSLYCFGGAPAKATVLAAEASPLPEVSDGWTAVVKTLLHRNDLKTGLALVLGVKSGRLVEELAKQSSLMIVAVDPDHARLQALRARMDAAGLSGARVSTLEGDPLDFAFSPYLAAIVASEDTGLAGHPNLQGTVERLYTYIRPFGGEIWLPTSDAQDLALKTLATSSTKLPFSDLTRHGGLGGIGDGFTQIKRMGLPDEKLRLKPPFGLIAFGGRGVDVFDWSPMTVTGPGHVPSPPKNHPVLPPGFPKGYTFPTASTLSTTNSIFTSLPNPLFSLTEKFPGIPSSGAEKGCYDAKIMPPHRYGDFGTSQGKVPAFFDASAHYWGRLYLPEFGGCACSVLIKNGAVGIRQSGFRGGISATANDLARPSSGPGPGNIGCGCQVSVGSAGIVLAPMDDEEDRWSAYQTVRTSRPVEDVPIRQVGINFGARADRYVEEDGILWTHHPHAWGYGRISYTQAATPEAMPLVPVSYRGDAISVYRHSAQMEKTGPRFRGWVAASCVKGMTGIEIPLLQPAVALRAAAPPKIDGNLADACWDGRKRLIFTVNPVAPNPSRILGPTGTVGEYHATLRYDDTNLYVAAGARSLRYAPDGIRVLAVTLNSRERIADDVVLTCQPGTKRSSGIDAATWTCAAVSSTGSVPFSAEIAVPWKALEAAGLWKEQLVVNVNVSSSLLAAQYAPLYLDAARGVATETHPHTVRLYFAEMEGRTTGQRVFDVSLQGKPVLTRLDVVREAGGPKREFIKEFANVSIADRLDVGFEARAGEPMLSGIEIIGNYAPTDHEPNALPIAKVEASVLSGPAPLEVTFSARGSQDPDGQIVQCAWETGDGRLAKGSQLRHVFAEPGTYKVNLLVRDNRGGMATAQATVTATPGVPAAFVCRIRAKGGDYDTLSAWESAMRSDLIGGMNVSAGQSLLFPVVSRGTYAASDDGAAVTFAGGGTGVLRHVNGANLAYLTGCRGDIRAGTVTCASGRKFSVKNSGHPVYAVVAECYNDWPAGLKDSVSVTNGASGWITDSIRCVTIRAAPGHEHRGAIRDGKGAYAGFALKGDFDVPGLRHARASGIVVDPGGALSLGRGASVSRVLAGAVKLGGGGMAANVAATTLGAATEAGFINHHLSYYYMDGPNNVNAPYPARPGKTPGKTPHSHVSFYNCTATTFDPADQAQVEFINCLAAPGGQGFRDVFYADPGYANHCVSTDGSAIRWDCGDGSEGNAANQEVLFKNAAHGDYRLSPADRGARGRGAPGLGADIAGRERPGPTCDIGAYRADNE